ncbi:hypothetical protein L873DRAFT_1802918 [Choiromyces venosus 120613-1]|uniref:Uncharacterized protein n=1 Tax=Choiromyces venosus 120613-1 TaxID=1336337 RepID=A0A3N4K0V2_9PEZI|nr:hypothetical protein L873DRAFT_1802918 [Choiromyces venosus 120613-1]
MPQIQNLAQLLDELAERQGAYEVLNKRIGKMISKQREEASSPKFTNEQNAYRAKYLDYRLESLYDELHDLGANIERMEAEVRDLEAAESLLSLSG